MTPISLTCPALTGGAFPNERCVIARSLRFSGGSTSGLSSGRAVPAISADGGYSPVEIAIRYALQERKALRSADGPKPERKDPLRRIRNWSDSGHTGHMLGTAALDPGCAKAPRPFCEVEFSPQLCGHKRREIFPTLIVAAQR